MEVTVFNPGKISLFLGVFLAVSLLVVAAIMLDLWDGVHTAKATKTRIHSHKLRVTIEKMSEYWRFIIIGFLIDSIGYLFSFYILPFLAMLFGAGLICVEIKSMFEHAKRRKSHTADLPFIIKSVIDCANEHEALALIEKITDTINKPEQATEENVEVQTTQI